MQLSRPLEPGGYIPSFPERLSWLQLRLLQMLQCAHERRFLPDGFAQPSAPRAALRGPLATEHVRSPQQHVLHPLLLPPPISTQASCHDGTYSHLILPFPGHAGSPSAKQQAQARRTATYGCLARAVCNIRRGGVMRLVR